MKTDRECRLVHDIWSDATCGQHVSESQKTFVTDHVSGCSECKNERSLLTHYSTNAKDVLTPELDDLSRRRAVDSILAESAERIQIDHRSDSPSTSISWKQLIGGIAAAIVVALGAVIWWSSNDRLMTNDEVALKNTPIADESLFTGELLEVQGSVRLSRLPVSQGTTVVPGSRILVEEGSAAIGLKTDVKIKLQSNTEVELSSPDRRRVELMLHYGSVRAQVKPKIDRLPFVISTRRGQVVVTGTEFLVRDKDNRVWLEVYKGSVRVEEPGRTPRSIKSGHGTELMGDGELVALQPKNAEGEPAADAQTGSNEAPDASVPSRFKGNQRRSADDLLRRAHGLRLSSNWQGAVEMYQRLIRLYPKSDEAQTSLVSLGLIQLKHLSQPRRAQRSFQRYLSGSSKKSLAQEALYGCALAFRAMNKPADERKILQRLIRQFPNSLQAQKAKERLPSIQNTL